jgi:hypothetical protein
VGHDSEQVIGFRMISGQIVMDWGSRKERMQRNKLDKIETNQCQINNINDFHAENRISKYLPETRPDAHSSEILTADSHLKSRPS